MTLLLILTHLTLFVAGITCGLALAWRALQSPVKSDRFWNGK